jgi:hypothetical protein
MYVHLVAMVYQHSYLQGFLQYPNAEIITCCADSKTRQIALCCMQFLWISSQWITNIVSLSREHWDTRSIQICYSRGYANFLTYSLVLDSYIRVWHDVLTQFASAVNQCFWEWCKKESSRNGALFVVYTLSVNLNTYSDRMLLKLDLQWSF